MRNLYLDFDGVVCDTIDITYKMLEEMGLDYRDKEICEPFYQKLDWNEVFERCHIINDSINCIQKIIDSGKFNVAFLTHVNSIGEIESKVDFIMRHFPNITIISVPKSISKTQMVNVKDSILIDDYTQNLIEWKQQGGYGIKFDLEMEYKGFPVIDRLDKILTDPSILEDQIIEK